MIGTVPLFVIPGMLLFPFSYKIRYGFLSRWAYLVIWLLKVICNLSYEVRGKENIPSGPAIIFCKHQSMWETIALQTIFPPHLWILKKELMKVPFFGWALYMMESIAIDRKAGRKAVDQIVEQGTQRLNKGRWIVVFPEGTRIAPGERKKFGIGGAILAVKSGYPVVPVAHNGGEFWRRRALIKRPGVITVVIGKPIETKDRTAAEIKAMTECWINEAVDEISSIKYSETASLQAAK